MWNLFCTVEPKVIQPAKSLKEQLLLQEEKALTQIQEEVTQMLTSINLVLKADQTQSSNCPDSQTELIDQLENIVGCLQTQIATDNNKFEDCISYRDQQKMNQQEFFKTTLRAYESKKSELNKYIEQLEDKVQTLEMKGFKTYDLNPQPNNVLNGMSQSYLDKYMAKLQEIKQIQQGIHTIAIKNRNKALKGKQIYSSTELTQVRENRQNKQNQFGAKVGRVENTMKFSSLNELEKELELVLLKEEIMEDILDKKIKKCKGNFQKLACQENALKESMKKMGMVNEEKRRNSTNSLVSSKGFSQEPTPKNQLRKTSSIFNGKSEFNPQVSQTLSIDEKRSELKSHEEENELSHHGEQNDEQLPRFGGQDQDEGEDDEQVASRNFIEACESLITERFVGEDEEDGEELGLNEGEE